MSFQLPAWPPDWPEIQAAVNDCLNSGQWGRYHSTICSELQERVAQLHASENARLCCSGTAGLEIALRACRLNPGDEVILAAFDYPGNFRTIELAGAVPVLVDVEPNGPCLDANQLATAASDRVRVVVASHLFGVAADVRKMRELCDERDWIMIEDACQVAGMTIGGQPAGSFGHFATLSFGGSKLVSAGSGGALLCNSTRMSARLGSLLDRPGDTFPLSPLQAAVIQPQLDRLDELNSRRAATARFLCQEVNDQLPKWQWSCSEQANVEPAFYKVAWTAESAEHRARIVTRAEEIGLPIGPGFRSMSGCSERRCRKPVNTPHADRISDSLFVLDHRALLLPSTEHQRLAEALIQLHDQT